MTHPPIRYSARQHPSTVTPPKVMQTSLYYEPLSLLDEMISMRPALSFPCDKTPDKR